MDEDQQNNLDNERQSLIASLASKVQDVFSWVLGKFQEEPTVEAEQVSSEEQSVAEDSAAVDARDTAREQLAIAPPGKQDLSEIADNIPAIATKPSPQDVLKHFDTDTVQEIGAEFGKLTKTTDERTDAGSSAETSGEVNQGTSRPNLESQSAAQVAAIMTQTALPSSSSSINRDLVQPPVAKDIGETPEISISKSEISSFVAEPQTVPTETQAAIQPSIDIREFEQPVEKSAFPIITPRSITETLPQESLLQQSVRQSVELSATPEVTERSKISPSDTAAISVENRAVIDRAEELSILQAETPSIAIQPDVTAIEQASKSNISPIVIEQERPSTAVEVPIDRRETTSAIKPAPEVVAEFQSPTLQAVTPELPERKAAIPDNAIPESESLNLQQPIPILEPTSPESRTAVPAIGNTGIVIPETKPTAPEPVAVFNAYEKLGVPFDATYEQITQRFSQLPPNNETDAAFEQVRTKERRESHDRKLIESGVLPQTARPLVEGQELPKTPPTPSSTPRMALPVVPDASSAARPTIKEPAAVTSPPTASAAGGGFQPPYVITTISEPSPEGEPERDGFQISREFATFDQPIAQNALSAPTPQQAIQPATAEAAVRNLPSWLAEKTLALSKQTDKEGVSDQIADLASQEYSAKQISEQLGVSEETVMAVRVARGIPSMNAGGMFGPSKISDEFRKWQSQYKQEKAAPQNLTGGERSAIAIQPTESVSRATVAISPLTGEEREPAEQPRIAMLPPPLVTSQEMEAATPEGTAIQANIAASSQSAADRIDASGEDLAGVLDSLTSNLIGFNSAIDSTTDKVAQFTEAVKFATVAESTEPKATGAEATAPLITVPSSNPAITYTQVPQLRQQQAQEELREYRQAITGNAEGLSPRMQEIAKEAAWLQSTPKEEWSQEQWDLAQYIRNKFTRLKQEATGETEAGGLAEPSYGSERPVMDIFEQKTILPAIPGELFTPPQQKSAIDEAVETASEIKPLPKPEPTPKVSPSIPMAFRPSDDEDVGGGGSGGGGQGRGGGGQQGSGGGRSDNSWANWLAVQAIPGTVSYFAQRGVSVGAESASPFIGEANASAVGGAAQSAVGALVGAGTAAAGLATGNPLFIAQGMAMLGKELVSLPKNISDWSKALMDSQFAMKEWSSETAQIWTKVEVREILRGQASAEATAATLEESAMEWQRTKDYWRPTKDWWTNKLNRLSADFAFTMRGFTDDEQRVLDEAKKSGEFERWKQHKGYLSTFSTASEDYIQAMRKEHPEKFRDEGQATYEVFEQWMRDWQNGKYMAPQSMRPAPVAP